MHGTQSLIDPRNSEEVSAWAQCMFNISYMDLFQALQRIKNKNKYKDPTALYETLIALRESPEDTQAFQSLVKILTNSCTMFQDINRGWSYSFTFENLYGSNQDEMWILYFQCSPIIKVLMKENGQTTFELTKAINKNIPMYTFRSGNLIGSQPVDFDMNASFVVHSWKGETFNCDIKVDPKSYVKPSGSFIFQRPPKI